MSDVKLVPKPPSIKKPSKINPRNNPRIKQNPVWSTNEADYLKLMYKLYNNNDNDGLLTNCYAHISIENVPLSTIENISELPKSFDKSAMPKVGTTHTFDISFNIDNIYILVQKTHINYYLIQIEYIMIYFKIF